MYTCVIITTYDDISWLPVFSTYQSTKCLRYYTRYSPEYDVSTCNLCAYILHKRLPTTMWKCLTAVSIKTIVFTGEYEMRNVSSLGVCYILPPPVRQP